MENKEPKLRDTNNDWVSKERIRESKLSVWSLDDSAFLVRQEHAASCEKEGLSNAHRLEHAQYIKFPHKEVDEEPYEHKESHLYEKIQRAVNKKESINENVEKKKNAYIYIIIFIIYLIMMMLSIFFN